MDADLGVVLGRALRTIRSRTTGTQDRWCDRTGMSQSYLSAAERGGSGWESVRTIAGAISRAGADPFDLLREALAEHDEVDTEIRQLLELWAAVDPVTRGAILTLLRAQAATSRTAAER